MGLHVAQRPMEGVSECKLTLNLALINSWNPGVKRNIGFSCTIHVPPGLKGLISLSYPMIRRY